MTCHFTAIEKVSFFIFPFQALVLLRLKSLLTFSQNRTKKKSQGDHRPFKRQPHKLPTNSLSVFDHFVRLALKGLIKVGTE